MRYADKYNQELQREADAFARRYGYFCALYIGATRHKLVFEARDTDNQPKFKFFPTYFIYEHDRFSLVRAFMDYSKYDKELVYKYYPQIGKEIYETYDRMDRCNVAVSEEDMSKIRSIIAKAWSSDESKPVLMEDIYESLEIADRLGMTIEFFLSPASKNKKRGKVYYIRIVPGRLPERIWT